MDRAITAISIFGIVSVAFVVFGIWFIGRIATAIGRKLGFIQAPRMMPPLRAVAPANFSPTATAATGAVQCRVPGCRHVNPARAQFCRHCGHAFPQGNGTSMRGAATV
jgi:hypothetical protein